MTQKSHDHTHLVLASSKRTTRTRPTAGTKCRRRKIRAKIPTTSYMEEGVKVPARAFCPIQNCFSTFCARILNYVTSCIFLTPAASRVTPIRSAPLQSTALIRIQMPFLHRESHVSSPHPHPFQADPSISDSAQFLETLAGPFALIKVPNDRPIDWVLSSRPCYITPHSRSK